MSPSVKWKCIKHFIPAVPLYFEETNCLVFPLPYKYVCYSQSRAIFGCWCFNSGIAIMLLDVCSHHKKKKCTCFEIVVWGPKRVTQERIEAYCHGSLQCGVFFLFDWNPCKSFLILQEIKCVWKHKMTPDRSLDSVPQVTEALFLFFLFSFSLSLCG